VDAKRGRTGNLLLDSLTLEERDSLLSDSTERRIEVGQSWRVPGDPIDTVIFPIRGTLSLIAETGDGQVESATIGREGAADVFAALGSRVAAQALIAQIEGNAIETRLERFDKVYDSGPTARRLIHGYIEALFMQTATSAVCLAVHHLNERCARWLLQCHDRVDDDTFVLKQEFLALMLGVHRPSVSIAAKTLQASGLITYRRGKITITDREGLEDAACPCYEEIRSAYSRLVPLS
jgi:CRP-like cAMP-binding protein